MSIARKLSEFLHSADVNYLLVHHQHTSSSAQTAEQAHVPEGALAKGVVVREDGNYMVAVVPANAYIELDALRRALGRDVHLAGQRELQRLFPDCDPGAVPPVGEAYGLPTIWDAASSLGEIDTVYFEAGDHENVVRVSGEQFHQLMATADRAHFSHYMQPTQNWLQVAH